MITRSKDEEGRLERIAGALLDLALTGRAVPQYAQWLMSSKSRKWLLLAAAVALLGCLVYRSSGSLGLSGFSGRKLWAAIQGANPLWLSGALILIYLCYAIRSLRWQVFQKNLGRAQLWEIYPATLAGFSAVFLLGRA